MTTTCTNCGEVHETATAVKAGFRYKRKPQDGDPSICFHCGHLMIFENGALRNPNDAEMQRFAGHPQILEVQNALAEVKRKRGL